ncbi:hypothetical protein AAC387_Pa02g0856 [Persea americana]
MPLLHLPPHGEGSETNLQDEIDDNTGRPFIPYISSRNTFLFPVITPIYDAVKAEVAPPLTPPAELRRHQRAAIITAWDETTYPWEALARRDVKVRVLTIFITWAVLRVLRSVLDGGTQYSLVSRETAWLGERMLLKTITAMGWSVVFSVLYSSIWSKKWG